LVIGFPFPVFFFQVQIQSPGLTSTVVVVVDSVLVVVVEISSVVVVVKTVVVVEDPSVVVVVSITVVVVEGSGEGLGSSANAPVEPAVPHKIRIRPETAAKAAILRLISSPFFILSKLKQFLFK